MKGSLRSVLEQWTLYRRASDEINGYLMEGRYSVCRLQVLNGSLEAVQQRVESLEVSSSQYLNQWGLFDGLRERLKQHQMHESREELRAPGRPVACLV